MKCLLKVRRDSTASPSFIACQAPVGVVVSHGEKTLFFFTLFSLSFINTRSGLVHSRSSEEGEEEEQAPED